MIIRQLSVFLENKKGRLSSVVNILSGNGIDISALSLADTAEYGILRLIVDQPDKAKELLSETGVTVGVKEMLAIAMDDVPGGMVGILNLLAEADLNVEYIYAFTGRVSGKALAVLKIRDLARAEQLMQDNGYAKVNPADIYRI